MIQYKKINGSFDMTGKTALITGGAGGIGEAAARMFAGKGARLALIDMKDNVDDVARQIAEEFKTEAIGIRCDITDVEDVNRVVDAVMDRFGEINVLSNVAGCVDLDNAEDIDFKLVENQMNVNALGPFRLTQRVANEMIRQGKGGKIVSVTSQAGFIAIDKHVGYTMSKAALIGMTKVLALEWAEFGINVNAVAPTVVRTYMGDRAWKGKVKEDMIEAIPAHRFAEVDEIAAAILFLSCDESNMITGENLVVDGGFTIK
ncbi:GolD/DthD family dehydrogenase [Extibacter muris]|uniref:GolD/DthD family dehydrogenase n=1 Tax=Extibacter muris TaxID=1796622 RepID=UPI001D08516B|nr:D-threitol dehydrogenase [Extibacter muris]MCB6203239.1 D-threitol dehydrogenase [Extibacter muris]MCQ4664835.1 D-threitol dehydrogenase [Extibacter muris]MCQ4694844.1 D-threitol dehydrogenase [Extibacter muris]